LNVASAAATEGRNTCLDTEDSGFDLGDEIVRRACAVADGAASSGTSRPVCRTLGQRLDERERRARRLASATSVLAPAAALEFVGAAIAAATVEGLWAEGAAQTVVARVAAHLHAAEDDASLVVFRSAISSRECIELPPALAVDFILSLLVDLGAAAGISLWTAEQPGSTDCIAAAGRGGRSRRLHETARLALDGVPSPSGTFRAAVVERWDQPFAALVARSRTAVADALLAEAAGALAPVLEREALYDRGAARERELVAAGERRLVRLGFDLHDGPLQQIVAFAEDLRTARSHIEPLLDAPTRARAAGCFEDLGARLEALDTDLRQIAHSVRSTTALDRPLEDAVRRETDGLSRAGIATELTVIGSVDTLTDSQKIVIYRVVQEALNNVRKHSAATSARVRIRCTSRILDVVVSDNGCGIDADKATAQDRLGLAGVAERVHMLGGVVSIGGGPEGGTQVSATLPVWRAQTDTTALPYAATA
jgi:signal transduction histidine kinase